ncbi:MAG: DNA-3-methyladenine glycosylase [Planctomycetota bacterium]
MDATFFDRDPIAVARDLLGCGFRRQLDGRWTGGIIVETEAYLSRDDPASHAARGCTPSNQSMFGPAGRLYVYPIHAKYCVNFVTQRRHTGAAVLIRALQPVWNLDGMRDRRQQSDPRRWTSGPAMICQVMQIDRSYDGLDILSSPRWSLTPDHRVAPIEITAGPRIGVSKGVELPLRFFIDGNRFVSGRASDHRRPRCQSIPVGLHGSQK